MLFKYKFIGVLIIILINTPFCCFSQQSSHLEKGNFYYYTKANEFFLVDSDSVLHYITLASEEFLKGEHWEEYVLTINSFCSYYQRKNDDKKRQEYALKALEQSRIHLEETNIMSALSLGNHSFFLKDIGDYTTAIKNFRQVLEIEILNEKHDFAASSLKIIGDTYSDIGDLDQAIKFYDEAFRYDDNHPKSLNASNKIDIYRRRGNAYLKKNNLEEALIDLRKAETLLPEDKMKKANVNNYLAIEINYGFANVYLAKNDYANLKLYVDKAFNFCTGDFESNKGIGYSLLGQYQLNNNNIPDALKNLLAAEKQIEEKFKKYSKHIEFSKISNLIGSAYLLNNQNKKAVNYFKKSIYNLSNVEFSDEENLVPKTNHLFNPYSSLQAYVGIGEATFNLYQETQKIEYLAASNTSFENAANLIFEVRKSYEMDNSLLRFSEEAIPIYEAAIEAALTQYEYSGDQKHVEIAFNYAEKSKAILLLESINQSSAIQISDISGTLIQKEKELKLQISGLSRKLYDEENVLESPNEFRIEQLSKQLFADTEAYDALLRNIEEKHPEYYELKYDNKTANIKDIQSRLAKSKTQLIEFFFGIENIYVFAISENELEINSIPNKETLTADIQKVKDFLSTPPKGANIKKSLSDYIQSSKNIFDQLIKKSIFSDTKHLVFINDGALGYLPLEALITSAPKSQNISFSLDNLSYLIEDFDVSYSYSSTLFLNSFSTNKYEGQNTFFGVAPSFGKYNDKQTRVCNENALYSLQCSKDEVLQIKNQLGGKVLIGKDATLEKTKEEISKSKIIHLATHACLDDKNPEFNKIYLADDYLSNNDLYNLKLNSELAVLSACDTGSGRLAKGEGVMSLARGFIHAGCPSIIMSLWSIDDCATSKIMVNFYDELYQGKTKTDALRNAKLNYIKEAKRANQHPYYWAAFVQIGNYNPIEISSFHNYLFYLLAFSLFCIATFYFFTRKK